MKIECTVEELKELLNIKNENEIEITTMDGEKKKIKTPVAPTTDVILKCADKIIYPEENHD